MAAEPVKSKPPASWVATDIGSSVWDSVTPGTKAPEERGWAKFPDFQPFCCSEAAPRCSSPVDNDSEGSAGQSQDENSNAASPCAWNVCVARKAPLVASDSSSSGDSDSEEEEEAASVVTETISTGSGQETVLLTVDTKNEKALFISSNNSVTVDKLASPLTGEATPALDILPHSAAAAVTPEAKRDSRNEEPHPGTEAPLKGPA